MSFTPKIRRVCDQVYLQGMKTKLYPPVQICLPNSASRHKTVSGLKPKKGAKNVFVSPNSTLEGKAPQRLLNFRGKEGEGERLWDYLRIWPRCVYLDPRQTATNEPR